MTRYEATLSPHPSTSAAVIPKNPSCLYPVFPVIELVPFDGRSKNELENAVNAEKFIQAIEDSALRHGRECDFDWKLHVARRLLSGQAIRWLAAQKVEVETDWRVFRQALLDNHPFVRDLGPSPDESGSALSASSSMAISVSSATDISVPDEEAESFTTEQALDALEEHGYEGDEDADQSFALPRTMPRALQRTAETSFTVARKESLTISRIGRVYIDAYDGLPSAALPFLNKYPDPNGVYSATEEPASAVRISLTPYPEPRGLSLAIVSSNVSKGSTFGFHLPEGHSEGRFVLLESGNFSSLENVRQLNWNWVKTEDFISLKPFWVCTPPQQTSASTKGRSAEPILIPLRLVLRDYSEVCLRYDDHATPLQAGELRADLCFIEDKTQSASASICRPLDYLRHLHCNIHTRCNVSLHYPP